MKAETIVNSCYAPVYTSKCRYKDIAGGRGRGGSHFVTQYFLDRITMPYYFRGYFIRKIKADIAQSLYQDFKDRVQESSVHKMEDFHFNETKYTIICKATGNIIFSRGTTSNKGRTASMKSIAGATHLAIEEFDELSEDEFDQLDLSIRKQGLQVEIFRIYNQPPIHHWLYRDFNLEEVNVTYASGKDVKWFKASPKTGSDILYIHTTYEDNIENLNESILTKFESFKIQRPEYYFNQIKGLIGTGSRGQIYSDWKSITNKEYQDIDEPEFFGLDFGYGVHATALVGVKKSGGKRYIREYLFSSEPFNDEKLKRTFKALGLNLDSIIIADGGNGGNVRVSELRRETLVDDEYLSFTVYLANKYPGSVNKGIDDLKSCDVYVTEDSLNIWREYREYKWLLNVNKEPTDKPNKDADVDNTLDAIRYVEITDTDRFI